jgi:hypothetical protein
MMAPDEVRGAVALAATEYPVSSPVFVPRAIWEAYLITVVTADTPKNDLWLMFEGRRVLPRDVR